MLRSIAWDRPSTVLLVVLAGVNLALPIAHFWPEPLALAEARIAAGSPPARTPEPTSRVPAPDIEPAYRLVPTSRVARRQPPPACRAWGPFRESGEAAAVARRLRLRPGSFEVVSTRRAGPADYLVTVRADGMEARQLLEALREQDVDSQLLDGAADGVRVAVGVFRSANRARAQQRRMAALGYDAAVETLDRARGEYHLLARIPPGRDLPVPPAGACGDIAPLNQFL